VGPASSDPIPLPSPRLDRWCWATAFGVTTLWFFLYAPSAGAGLCDEPGHLAVLQHFYAKRPGWPDTLPHPPGYHWLVLWLTPGEPTRLGSRLVTFGCALLMLGCYGAAWRRFHAQPAGPAVLLLALLPILQPFTAMVYTDVPALAFLLAAWWTQLARRPWLAALLLAAACFIRQTSIIWGSFLIAFEMWRTWRQSPVDSLGRRFSSALHLAWPQIQWLALLHAVVAGVVLHAGRLTPGTQHGNAVDPNLATLHFGGLLLALLGLPLWLRALPGELAAAARAFREKPALVLMCALAAVGAVAGLALFYGNPHIWNRDLWWPDTSFTLLRNWPLVYADRFPLLRLAWSMVAVVTAVGLWRSLSRQESRIELSLVAGFSVVLLALNGLVEPRYFITPVVFWLFFLRLEFSVWRTLAVWWALLCAAHAPFIIRLASLW